MVFAQAEHPVMDDPRFLRFQIARFVDRLIRYVPLVVCPLQFEASTLRRALAQDLAADSIVCCGPGAGGVERWAASASCPPRATVILAGLAGSVAADHRAGEAFAVDAIRGGDGRTWTPAIRMESGAATIITSADRAVTARSERLELAQRSGAHLVDLESVAFAQLATARGWRWGIVRGVSDDLSTAAPGGIDRWIAPDGRTRIAAVMAALVRKPWLARDLRCLHHNSKTALTRAGRLVAQMLPAALDE